MTRIGADDFLLRKSADELLERCIRPLWRFSFDTSQLDNIAGDTESIRAAIMPIIIMPEIDLEAAAQRIKSRTKIGINFIRDEIFWIKNKWNKFAPPTPKGEEGDIVWDSDTQKISDLNASIGKKLEKNPNAFIDPATHTLIMVDREKRSYRRIIDGHVAARFFGEDISFIKIRSTNKDKPVSGYDLIPKSILDVFLININRHTKLPHLSRFTVTPIVVGGKLINAPGYYPELKTLYLGPDIVPKYTFEKLAYLLETFPFRSHADLVCALGSIISAVLFRHSYIARRPMVYIHGDSPNLGKSTFVKVKAVIAFGYIVESMPIPKNEDELEKKIASKVETKECLFFDNIRAQKELGSALLERVITDPKPTFRRLGGNTEISVENTLDINMTQNFGKLVEDLRVRSLSIFLTEKKMKNMPDHFDPVAFAMENRLEILSEIAGMFRVWENTGCPSVSVNFPKFPDWAANINGLLLANGFKGFLANYAQALVVLDAVASGLICVGAAELAPSGKVQTEKRSAEAWRTLLESADNNVFDSESTGKSRDTKVGITLRKMAGGIYSAVTGDGEDLGFKIKIEMEDNSSKSGGNRHYRFCRIEATISNDENQIDIGQAARTLTSVLEGAATENESNHIITEVPGTSSPNPETLETKNNSMLKIPPPKHETTSHSASDEVPDHQAMHTLSSIAPKFSDCGTLPKPGTQECPPLSGNCYERIVSLDPTKLWEELTPSRQFTYEFRNQMFPSRLWADEKIGHVAAIDFETTMAQETNEIPQFVMGSVFDGSCIYFLTSETLSPFLMMNTHTIFWAHNAVFELTVMAKHLNDPRIPFSFLDRGRLIDTLLLSRLIGLATTGNPKDMKGKYSLEALALSKIGAILPKNACIGDQVIRTSYDNFLKSLNAAPDGYFHYNAFDSIATLFLAQILVHQVVEIAERTGVDQNLLLSHFGQIKTSFAAHLTERNSFAIDSVAVRENSSILKDKIGGLDRILKTYNFAQGPGRDKKFEAILYSLEMKHNCQFVKLPDKKGRLRYSRQEGDLSAFSDIEFIGTYLKREFYAKRLSTFVKPYEDKEVCQPTINVLMESGRVSYSGHALQTIPLASNEENLDFRRQFVGHNNNSLIITDIVGAELVTLSQYCLDKFGFSDLGDAMNAHLDVHRITASKFFGRPPESLTKLERNYGKIPNFGLPGGAGPKTLIRIAKLDYGTEISEEMANSLITAWLGQYREMKLHLSSADRAYEAALFLPPHPEWGKIESSVKQHIFFGIISGQSYTKTSRRPYSQSELDWAWSHMPNLVVRYPWKFAPFAKDIARRQGSDKLAKAAQSVLVAVISRSGRVRAGCARNDFLNNPFQGLLADITNDAWYELHKAGVPVLHTVHDEIISQAISKDPTAIEVQVKLQEEIIIASGKKFCPDVVMRVETKVSRHWTK